MKVILKRLVAGESLTAEETEQVSQPPSEKLPNGLMAKAHAEHRLLTGIGLDDIKQQTRL